jgi:LuxR family transcriptional activator of conjugal transfer of Ti plasmids
MNYWEMWSPWLRAMPRVECVAGLQESIAMVAGRFGFRFYLFHAHFPGDRGPRGDFYLDNCPAGWSTFYREGKAGDLRAACGTRQVTPMMWREIATRLPELYATAREFGLVAGCIHPMHGPSGQWSSMSFLKDRDDAKAEAEIQAAMPRCQLLVGHVHEAAARILAAGPAAPHAAADAGARGSGLNEREREVLTWIAAGKTACETATILSLSERTVLFYLSNARRKLGATNSCHAITKALSLGWIDPDRARPGCVAGPPGIGRGVTARPRP